MAFGEIIGGFSGFKMRLLLAAGCVVFCGLLWSGGRKLFQDEKPKPAVAPSSAMAPTNWTAGPSAGERAAEDIDRIGEGAVRFGLSFMIAMVAASILRAALRTGLTLIAVAGLAIWFLEYNGHISLWSDYIDAVQGGGSWLSTRAAAFGELCRQHIPSTGAALVGFGFGLKR